ncbi:hypothetical protein AB3479_36880, partial [Rhizobium mongolense]
RLNIETCVTPPCKSGTKSRVSPQPDSRPGQLSLHQSAHNFTVPAQAPRGVSPSIPAPTLQEQFEAIAA